MASGGILGRLAHAWNAFTNATSFRDPPSTGGYVNYGYVRPDRTRLSLGNERSIISAIYTRMAIDIASIPMMHVRLDDQRRYTEDINSGLNNCLTLEANTDQAATAFRQDIVLTLFDKGSVAIVPVDTTLDPSTTGGYDILTMRVGEVVSWHPKHIRVRVYNEAKGYREEITLEKSYVAIVENPLYAVMNESSSTLQRLIKKLNLLDAVDEQSASGKLDIIIQMPYTIRSEARKQQAQQRRTEIETQLSGSKYGIAYSDATEKIVQLNRPAENNLMTQVEYLTKMLYGQLGITEEIMNGTADEVATRNYMNRTVKPVLNAVAEAMRRTFLTKTGRSQGQWIQYFPEVFSLVPLKDLAEIADKLTRNKIVTSNEMRGFIGLKPSKDPDADKLQNANMPADKAALPSGQPPLRVPATVGQPRRELTAAPSEPPTQQ